MWYTASKDGKAVYAMMLSWPQSGTVSLTQVVPGSGSGVELLGLNGVALQWKYAQGRLAIVLPDLVSLPSALRAQTAWTLKLTAVQ